MLKKITWFQKQFTSQEQLLPLTNDLSNTIIICYKFHVKEVLQQNP